MMASILGSYEELQHILAGTQHFDKIAVNNKADLTELVTFLDYFVKLAKILAHSDLSIQHNIVPCLAAAKNHCEKRWNCIIVSYYAKQVAVQLEIKFIDDSNGQKYVKCLFSMVK